MVNNLDARQNDILSMINTNLERIAIALENIGMKKNYYDDILDDLKTSMLNYKDK